MINLGITFNKTMKQSFGADDKSVPSSANRINFTGATDIFRNNFIKTQKEIADIFEKDMASDGIAGTLPKNWTARISAGTEEEKAGTIQKVLLAFRAAVKHLKPYNAPESSREFTIMGTCQENKRIKEASEYLTKALRHFGILPEDGSVKFKRRKVTGAYIDRGYALFENSKHPVLERLFIKKFKKLNSDRIEADFNGKYAETAHGLNLNELNSKYISQIYWGDMRGDFIAAEYETPPKYSSPIVKFRKSYESISEFAADFYAQTGIKAEELSEHGISAGKFNEEGKFVPASKEELITGYLQAILAKAGLFHNDLHCDNAIIGTGADGNALVKIVDIGGISKS